MNTTSRRSRATEKVGAAMAKKHHSKNRGRRHLPRKVTDRIVDTWKRVCVPWKTRINAELATDGQRTEPPVVAMGIDSEAAKHILDFSLGSSESLEVSRGL